jgi:hypothetical protein
MAFAHGNPAPGKNEPPRRFNLLFSKARAALPRREAIREMGR